MLTLTLYRRLLSLYPAPHREQFSEEMIAVFDEMQAEKASKGVFTRSVFYARETAGLVTGALRERWRYLACGPVSIWFPKRRFTMRNGFRFPKATSALMAIILAGVMAAIKMGEAIVASVPHVGQPVGTIHPAHSVLLGGVVVMLAFFYAAGLIGWAILFAMRRSGVHRLEIAAQSK